MKPKTFASLFTGGGLADIGAMQAGYELLWGVEFDSDIAAVANANLPHREQVYAESVVLIDWAKMTRPDHLHMSPPCQDFSVAKTSGKVGNDNDALADACIEALRVLQPSTVTLENVEGYRKAPDFQRIVDHLWGAGYWVNVDVLNSADFGVPQTRRRLFLRAVKGGFPGPLPEPIKPWRGWYEAIEDLIPTLPETQFAAWQLERLPEGLKSYLCHGTERQSPDYDHPVRRNDDLPSWTLKACDYKGLPKAYLVESKNANQQYGDGIRQQDEPHTTVITDHKPSHQPKALIVHANDQRSMPTRDDGDPMFTVLAGGNHSHAPGIMPKALLLSKDKGDYSDGHRWEESPAMSVTANDNGRRRAFLVPGGNSNSFSLRDGDEPCRTVESVGRVGNIPRAYLGSTEEEREEFEYQERLRWAEEDRDRCQQPVGRVVRMTPRALSRFQTVPDWYVLPEKNALACKIIGNGVPCLMMQRVMESF